MAFFSFENWLLILPECESGILENQWQEYLGTSLPIGMFRIKVRWVPLSWLRSHSIFVTSAVEHSGSLDMRMCKINVLGPRDILVTVHRPSIWVLSATLSSVTRIHVSALQHCDAVYESQTGQEGLMRCSRHHQQHLINIQQLSGLEGVVKRREPAQFRAD